MLKHIKQDSPSLCIIFQRRVIILPTCTGVVMKPCTTYNGNRGDQWWYDSAMSHYNVSYLGESLNYVTRSFTSITLQETKQFLAWYGSMVPHICADRPPRPQPVVVEVCQHITELGRTMSIQAVCVPYLRVSDYIEPCSSSRRKLVTSDYMRMRDVVDNDDEYHTLPGRNLVRG